MYSMYLICFSTTKYFLVAQYLGMNNNVKVSLNKGFINCVAPFKIYLNLATGL